MACQHGPGTSDQAHHQHSGLGSCLRRRFHSLTGLFHRSTGYRQTTIPLSAKARKLCCPLHKSLRGPSSVLADAEWRCQQHTSSSQTINLVETLRVQQPVYCDTANLCREGKCLCCHVHQQKGQANVSGWDCGEAPLRVTTAQPLFAAPGSPQASKLLVKLLRSKDWS
jgi:hypothetical protein